jgi:DNA-binding CsgD family transcriptional regulator
VTAYARIVARSARNDRQQLIAHIARLSRGPADLVTFWREVTEVLRHTVPYYWTPCWYTLDPASLLITSHFREGLDKFPPQWLARFPPEWLAREYYGNDVNRLADVVTSETGISTLHEATKGKPAGSPRWQHNMELGGDQELIIRLRSRTGQVWGALGLYRETGWPLFGPADKEFLQAVAPHLAEGARHGLLAGEASDPDRPDPPARLLLTHSWEVESATPAAARWLSDLGDGDWEAGRLPPPIRSLAGTALHGAEHPDQPGRVITGRVLSRSGRWLILHGAKLSWAGARRAAVIIEPASQPRFYSLLASDYGLTEPEREITRLVLHGKPIPELSKELRVPEDTARQQLTGVLGKTGASSRRDLAGKIFYAHYEPRFRDNERRSLAGQPLRGGPHAAQPGSPDGGSRESIGAGEER